MLRIKSLFRGIVLTGICLIICASPLGQAGEAATTHRVASGDTLWLVSQRYNTTVAALQTANGISGSMIYPGQVLSIPPKTHTVQQGDTMWLISQRYGLQLSELISANPGISSTLIYPGQKITLPGLSASATSTPSAPSGHQYTQQEIDLLARLVHSEAAGEPYVGQVAVAASVLNRIRSSIYPNTVRGVVYQVAYGYYQYSPVLDGRINLPANRTAYQAVYDALGGRDPSNNALGFYNPRKTSNQWVRQQTVTTVIGNHIFFR